MLALDLIGPSSRAYPSSSNGTDHDTSSIQEAAAAGLQDMRHLISSLSSQPPNQNSDYAQITNSTITKFKHLISVLNRTGHARFRRGLSLQTPMKPKITSPQSLSLDLSISSANTNNTITNTTNNNNSSSFDLSSVTGDRSVSNRKRIAPPPPPAVPIGFPPVPVSSSQVPVSGVKRKPWCHEHAHSENVNADKCHCTKRRKSKVKKTVRVPAVSMSPKNPEIPPDEFAWRKYGQKPIKGSPYPRGYYKCSTRRGCPARKHVERDPQEPSMLIVTYEGDHLHNMAAPEQQMSLPPPVIRSESII